MVDRYVRSQGRKLSREAPVPVADFISEELVLGGAANLANNLVALGAKVRVIGVVGNDEPGKWIQEELENKGVDISYAVFCLKKKKKGGRCQSDDDERDENGRSFEEG